MRTSGASRPIRVACRRHDWTDALFEGQARPTSLDLEVSEQANVGPEGLTSDPPVADYAECGLTGLVRARAKGAPVLALPIFIRSAFRHSYIFVRTDANINVPRDLEGKRVGTRYNMTATVWARGFLQHDYGVHLERIHWLNQEPPEEGDYRLPPGLVLEPVPRDVDLRRWLLEGRIEALIRAEADGHRFPGRGTVKRLFPDAGQEERNWWRRTHIVPGDDPVPYSVEKLRHAIETLLRYCAEQGLVERTLAVEDLFFTGLDS